MFKIILALIVGFVVYKLVKKFTAPKKTFSDGDKTTGEELIECSKCGTFTPRSEITFGYDGPVCKDCK
jgi:hypothetical protein